MTPVELTTVVVRRRTYCRYRRGARWYRVTRKEFRWLSELLRAPGERTRVEVYAHWLSHVTAMPAGWEPT